MPGQPIQANAACSYAGCPALEAYHTVQDLAARNAPPGLRIKAIAPELPPDTAACFLAFPVRHFIYILVENYVSIETDALHSQEESNTDTIRYFLFRGVYGKVLAYVWYTFREDDYPYE